MKIQLVSGQEVHHLNEDVTAITIHKAAEVLDMDDILGNGIHPSATVMMFHFKDGSISTYDAQNVMTISF